MKLKVSVLVCLLGAVACVAPVKIPSVVEPETPLGNGFPALLNFYQSFWSPPATDDDPLTVGIITSASELRFESGSPLLLKVFSEDHAFEIKSPPKTLWSVTLNKEISKGKYTYMAVVEARVFPKSKAIRSSSETLWEKRGFLNVRWLGPGQTTSSLERWLLALSPDTSKEAAEDLCKRARAISGFCKVVARTHTPPVWQGVIRAAAYNFEKSFSGYIEINSPGEPIDVIDFLAEPRTQKISPEKYEGPLYAIPTEQGQLAMVQKISLQHYLEAVVPSEIFPEATIEAVKAQAVVARTYMLRHLPENARPLPYTICASTLCQVYRGVAKRHPNTSRAVFATRSMVLWGEEGQPAETFYHGLCGGHTEDKSIIWGPPPRNYLTGISDHKEGQMFDLSTNEVAKAYIFKNPHAQTFCGSSTYTKPDRWAWERTFDEAALHQVLKELGLSPPLLSVEVLQRSRGGRALSLKLTTESGSKVIQSELKIRMLFGGLLSSLAIFEPTLEKGRITSLLVKGLGYGHGVGMCQVGAIGRAEQGASYGAILEAYYPGTTLATIMLK